MYPESIALSSIPRSWLLGEEYGHVIFETKITEHALNVYGTANGGTGRLTDAETADQD